MDSPEYGCNENKVEDDDSIVSDRCFKSTYKGDSRKWLVRDGFSKNGYENIKSTMKAEFVYPDEKEESGLVGERRAQIMQRLYDEAADEIIQERDAPPPVEEYCTEYDRNYSQIKVEKRLREEEEKQELFDKYPLYTSPAMSYWNFKIVKYQRGNVHFPGLSKSVDLKSPFKRYSGFTRPVNEVMEEDR